ncbi:hypothetical protein SAMN02746041_01982 [Desulfacinum hydrothermale DSM 13146]|uniref:Pyrimidine dimer DNA glycosylase /DNA-(Apurinic or apyrimidinic site) lyase n=1 Tax=Desulfacinum hydrothermale DSM 13146 TaxID=1121390 RepID=A0A1W1XLM4_9BACT|nr:pyrimidine dimer DNA glycosylase/endonuclease V [Desulfacinum hydrothermale]SMC24418.1 hypothetical protein SAMN02746041_01982 [Desulfacinum hydrothermale DSM 13146]
MRLWSLHPKYLDAKGLVALWREGLLAKAVLQGRTRGYTHHPQLVRFREAHNPLQAVNAYLHGVLLEAQARGYRFDETKVDPPPPTDPIVVTQGQLLYEWQHLLGKLKTRDPDRYRRLCGLTRPEAHPIFRVIPGPVAAWEKGASKTED